MRECDNPSPSRGGLYCTGDRVRYESCNIWDCQEDAEDFRSAVTLTAISLYGVCVCRPFPDGQTHFRQEQCAVFDGNNFDIDGVPTSVKWVPKYTSSKSNFSAMFAFSDVQLSSWCQVGLALEGCTQTHLPAQVN